MVDKRIPRLVLPLAIRAVLKWSLRGVVVATVIILTIILVRAFDARRMPDLKVWHTLAFSKEFKATDADAGFSFKDYQDLERELFKELDERVYARIDDNDKKRMNRYYQGSRVYPGRLGQNWNRSFQFRPARPKGGILLLHGLTDSPYSLRAVAEIFKTQGFYVLVPRLPGHGITPSALRQVSWQDWLAVVRLGARHVRSVIGDKVPFYLGGYSNGGALAVKYTLDSLTDDTLERPERLYLFSPAIGVTRFAVFASWHKLLSRIPYFEKFAWASVQPEYDPYKYNSFPKIAGYYTHILSNKVQRQIDDLKQTGALTSLPPILTFQSLVDSTVLTPSLIDQLYNKLESANNELVLFDVNRFTEYEDFIPNNRVRRQAGSLTGLNKKTNLPYALTLITNRDKDTLEVVARKWSSSERPTVSSSSEPLGLSWPRHVYSLSHVAIPFPPDDPYYGARRAARYNQLPPLGSLRPRGERDILSVPINQFMRLRYNPFFDYVKMRIILFCNVCSKPQSVRTQE